MSRSGLLGDGTRYGCIDGLSIKVSFKPDGKSDATFEITEIKPTRGVKTVFKVCFVALPVMSIMRYVHALRRASVAGSDRTTFANTNNSGQQHDTAVPSSS